MEAEGLRTHLGKRLRLYIDSNRRPVVGTVALVRDDVVVLREDAKVGRKSVVLPLPWILGFDELTSGQTS